ncbi:MAG: type II toxin-antitoxin system antitoxin DNA ADP-ribosyl glycohydrolase DarG [Acidiferrobacteraceae bacterium]
MIRYMQGDILKADTEALVNTVNCVGVMGRGIALQFKQAFPANFKAYAIACTRGEVQPGRMFVFETSTRTAPRYLINFPTKRHWRGKSRMEDIEAGLVALVAEVRARHVRSIAVPPLGSGLGGLDWAEVRPLIERAFATLPEVEVRVFEPGGGPRDSGTNPSRKAPKMTPGRAALVGLVNRYLAGLMDPSISLLEVHKLMYFMQEAGEPLRLRFVKAPYGPYAENLRHVLREMEGHLISGYADGGDAPGKQLALVPGAVTDAESFLQDHARTHQHFDRVASLVEGFETAFGLELLSTVHWVTARDGVDTADAAIDATYAWNDRKRQFSREQILLAWERLERLGWLNRVSTRP